MKTVELKVTPSEAWDEQGLKEKALQQLGISKGAPFIARLDKRSLDARSKHPVYRVRVNVYPAGKLPEEKIFKDEFMDVSNAEAVHIIGAGPAGYFAALECLSLGMKPIIIERGKDARSRRRDLRSIQQFHKVNPNSNYCFGEGGAGTYSDGKLYTRAHKKGNIFKAMKLLVEHGAKDEILIDAHPHIGSNKLPGIVENIRQSILDHGGEIHFNTLLTDIRVSDGRISAIELNSSDWLDNVNAVLLATGHSARDIFEILDRRGVHMEFKPFALGVRIEHPQPLIDELQYNQRNREEGLPAASYKLTAQVKNSGVYSFCMCPGGLVVPAATAPGEIVVNGMSLSKRDSPFANSGVVVSLEYEDLKAYHQHGKFAGLAFQRKVEQDVFNAGKEGKQIAPAQRLTDFLNGKRSTDLPDSSYIPGLWSASLNEILPGFIYDRLKHAVGQFENKMKGYLTEEAVVIATESRTSSPVRIPRDRQSYMHPGVSGLFPVGEGAGYAGGIISAAVDGQNSARAVARFLKIKK